MKVLIGQVIKKESERNEKMIREYESLISELPKGSLICRKNEYYYLKYRENGKLYDRYVGKDAAVIEEIKRKLALRHHYSEMLSALKREQKTICRLLEGLT